MSTMDKRMNPVDVNTAWSFRRTLVFWWMVFIIVQQAQRLFLLPEAMSVEMPTSGTLITTLIAGLRADVFVATLSIGAAALLATIGFMGNRVLAQSQNISTGFRLHARWMMASSLLVGLLLMGLLTIDMGYYVNNKQHLDFVFFEYLGNLMTPTAETPSEASLQTTTELQDTTKWGPKLLGLFTVQALMLIGWWYGFVRLVMPAAIRIKAAFPNVITLGLIGLLVAGASGLHPYGPWAVQRVSISSSVYYILAQNPVWYASETMLSTYLFGGLGETSRFLTVLPQAEAIRTSQAVLASEQTFPYPQYPFVKTVDTNHGAKIADQPNILLLFLEGLDRRYLGRTLNLDHPPHLDMKFIYHTKQYQGVDSDASNASRRIQLTPFLDRFRQRSIYFENFFTSGDQTARGLFATLCSYHSKLGWTTMRTRYTHDFLCLPSLLERAGYRNEMVLGQNRDRSYDHLGLFLARNGLHELLDSSDFPPEATRLGLGMTDGALFDFLRSRIEHLRQSDHPYFLTTLTVSTHPPYTVPVDHPDLQALHIHDDRYTLALRYLDLQFERFFTGLENEGLLENTVVFVLGDHGRHEGFGIPDVEAKRSRFTSPLYIWIDPSLRTESNYTPRVISSVASQVDITPTILTMAGLMPKIAPFVGHDLSCALTSDCLHDNVAFVASAHDDLIGIIDQDETLLYWLERDALYVDDVVLTNQDITNPNVNPQQKEKYKRMLGMYASSNMLLEQNRIWSWNKFSGEL